MLSAKSAKDQSFGLFFLALKLAKTKTDNIPSGLTEHYEKVISQAKLLIENQDEALKQPLLPESFRLAMAMKNDESLQNNVYEATTLRDLPENLAIQITKEVKRSLASRY